LFLKFHHHCIEGLQHNPHITGTVYYGRDRERDRERKREREREKARERKRERGLTI
jgi:hypothetical protein